MKKIFSALILVFTLCSSVYGASSDDVYLRKDVFDAKMEALFNQLHGEIKALSEKIDALDAKLSTRINGVERRIDGVDKRIDDLHNIIYLFLVFFGLVIALPFIQKGIEKLQTPQLFTPEEVKKLKALLESGNFSVQGK